MRVISPSARKIHPTYLASHTSITLYFFVEKAPCPVDLTEEAQLSWPRLLVCSTTSKIELFICHCLLEIATSPSSFTNQYFPCKLPKELERVRLGSDFWRHPYLDGKCKITNCLSAKSELPGPTFFLEKYLFIPVYFSCGCRLKVHVIRDKIAPNAGGGLSRGVGFVKWVRC
jgi:hypothetical protein